MTGYIEMREVAWPTATEGGSGEADVMQSAMCTARGGNKTVTDGQAICVSQRTVYPLGIELMRMALEHAFMPGSDESVFAHLSGGSNIAVGEAGAVTTYLRAANGTVVEMIASGGSISNSLAGWLALADVSLDQPNLNLTADYRDPTKFPTFRTAGVSLDVSIFFDNRDPQTRKPAYDSRDVFAEVTVSASRNVWAGTGPSVHYEAYPETDPVTGKEIYDKVYRYRQGVIFTFRTAGLMYIMNWQVRNLHRHLLRSRPPDAFAHPCSSHELMAVCAQRAHRRSRDAQARRRDHIHVRDEPAPLPFASTP